MGTPALCSCTTISQESCIIYLSWAGTGVYDLSPSLACLSLACPGAADVSWVRDPHKAYVCLGFFFVLLQIHMLRLYLLGSKET